MTPLHIACASGNIRMVETLLGDNADPEKTDAYKWNALFYATYGGNIRCVEKILNEGVNKRLKDRRKLMAIDWAEFLKHGEVASLLETFEISMSTDKYRGTFG